MGAPYLLSSASHVQSNTYHPRPTNPWDVTGRCACVTGSECACDLKYEDSGAITTLPQSHQQLSNDLATERRVQLSH